MELYKDIYEMPMHVYNSWKKSLLILSGIGDGIKDLETRIINASRLIERDDKSDAVQELKNTLMLLYNIKGERSALESAYKTLCKNQEDKHKVKDLSLETIQQAVEEVKKKSRVN